MPQICICILPLSSPLFSIWIDSVTRPNRLQGILVNRSYCTVLVLSEHTYNSLQRSYHTKCWIGRVTVIFFWLSHTKCLVIATDHSDLSFLYNYDRFLKRNCTQYRDRLSRLNVPKSYLIEQGPRLLHETPDLSNKKNNLGIFLTLSALYACRSLFSVKDRRCWY